MTEPNLARAVTKATVSSVIVRGCVSCQHPREIGKPCAGCGLEDPPVVVDLGVTSYTHKNPLRRLAWALVGSRRANWRIRKANQAARAVR